MQIFLLQAALIIDILCPVSIINRPNVEVANFYIFCSSNGPTHVCKIFQKVNDKQKSYTRFSKTPSYPLTLRSV